MAIYQFTIYTFPSLTLSGGSDLTSTPGSTQGFQTIGESFTYSGAPGTTLLVNDDDTAANDGNADPQGGGGPSGSNGNQVITNDPSNPGAWRNQFLQLEYRITVLITSGPNAGQTLDFFVVRIGPNNAGAPLGNLGIVGVTPPVPGESYQIIAVTDQQDGGILRTYTNVSGSFFTDQAGVNGVPWDLLACFTHRTLIDTPDGPRLIERLRPGDLVTTLDNGSQPLRWVGSRPVSRAEMLARPEFRPVLFEPGTMGNSRPLLVSPQHRMLLNDWRAQVYFGEDQVLIAAKALLNGKTIRQVLPDDGVTYCHLLFDRHEVILAEGALSESFHPGDSGLEGLDDDQRLEVLALFPLVALESRRAVFPIVRTAEARALLAQ